VVYIGCQYKSLGCLFYKEHWCSTYDCSRCLSMWICHWFCRNSVPGQNSIVPHSLRRSCSWPVRIAYLRPFPRENVEPRLVTRLSMVLLGIGGGGVVSRCDRRPKQRLNSCGYNKITTTNRKAPAFLRGLLQFGLSLERETGIEPATFCLGSKGSDPI
jgi:hypothetical protein